MARHQRKSSLTIKTLAFILLGLTINHKAYAELIVGDKINEATLFGLNTPSTKLSTYIGKPLIINFWASWCSPCVSEMQSLNNIANNQNYTIIGISTDDDAAAAMQLINKQQLTFRNYIDDKIYLEKTFGANTIPLTILVNKEGRIVKKIQGSQVWDSAKNKRAIQKIFKATQ